MNESIINKAICLNLNANWQPVGFKTVKDAIIDLCGRDNNGRPSSLALDIDYELYDNGEPIMDQAKSMNPVSWDEWMSLPIRKWDLTVSSVNRVYRVPTVIIATNFKKMPVKYFKGKPSKDAIYNRDKGICQYSGKKLDRHNATVDHVIPRSRGGADSWENFVLCSKDINSKKGNKLNSEIGLNLLKEPSAPQPIPVYALIREARHPDWKQFLIES
jgi:5-methylcytosine-specific restriction endonuclease McrA